MISPGTLCCPLCALLLRAVSSSFSTGLKPRGCIANAISDAALAQGSAGLYAGFTSLCTSLANPCNGQRP
eukprot:6230640-Pyramimonas_sp.AAC.1